VTLRSGLHELPYTTRAISKNLSSGYSGEVSTPKLSKLKISLDLENLFTRARLSIENARIIRAEAEAQAKQFPKLSGRYPSKRDWLAWMRPPTR
jgi:hypothetical protein